MAEFLILRDPSLIKPRARVEERSERQILLDGLTDRLSGVADDRVRGMIGKYVQDLAAIADEFPLREGATEDQEDDADLAMLGKAYNSEGYKIIDQTLGGHLMIPDDTTLGVLDEIRGGFLIINQTQIAPLQASGNQAPQGAI